MRDFNRSIFTALWLFVAVVLQTTVLHSTAQAQRLHALILTDTSPWADWGRYQTSVEMDSMVMMSLFATNVPKHQLVLDNFDLAENVLSDPARITQRLEQIQVGPNDTLFFYFSGHGGHDDRGHYLTLAGGRLYRDQIRAIVQQKGARLSVILTDCCNQRAAGQEFGAPAMDMEPPASVTPLFRSLFFEPQGIVDINGSSPGEAAFFTPLDSESEALPGSLLPARLRDSSTDTSNSQPLGITCYVRSA